MERRVRIGDDVRKSTSNASLTGESLPRSLTDIRRFKVKKARKIEIADTQTSLARARNSPIVKSQNLSFGGSKAGKQLTPFAQSREQMIDHYLDLAMEYKRLLEEHKRLKQQRQEVEMSIASIFMQGDRLDELIQKVSRQRAAPQNKKKRTSVPKRAQK